GASSWLRRFAGERQAKRGGIASGRLHLSPARAGASSFFGGLYRSALIIFFRNCGILKHPHWCVRRRHTGNDVRRTSTLAPDWRAPMLQPSILVVDQGDDQLVGTQLRRILQREPIWRVESVRTGANALTNPVPDLLISVLPESKKKAERLVGELTATTARPPILVVAKSDFLPVLSDDTLLSADDFIRSPLEEAEVLLRVRKFLHQRAHRPLQERVSEACGLAQLVGEDPAFCELKRKIPLVAQFESTVLLVGETGTGKERCARALHYLSRRADNSFLPVNCGAI